MRVFQPSNIPNIRARTSPRLGHARGAALVEAALLMIPLLLLVCGMIDAGWAMKSSQAAMLASRAGARAETARQQPTIDPQGCANHCDEGCGALFTGHRAACDYLASELGALFNPEDWKVILNTDSAGSGMMITNENGFVTIEGPGVGGTPLRRDIPAQTVKATVMLDTTRARPCIACVFSAFRDVSLSASSTFLLQRPGS